MVQTKVVAQSLEQKSTSQPLQLKVLNNYKGCVTFEENHEII
jgi:hypothetical protein